MSPAGTRRAESDALGRPRLMSEFTRTLLLAYAVAIKLLDAGVSSGEDRTKCSVAPMDLWRTVFALYSRWIDGLCLYDEFPVINIVS